MPGEVSCRALRPLLRYAGECGITPADLLAGLAPGEDLGHPDHWIPAAVFVEIMERAAALLGDPDLAARVGAAAGELLPLSPHADEGPRPAAPETVLARAGDMLALLQRDVQVVVPVCEPGRVVIECTPPAGRPPPRCVCLYARHLLAAIPPLWPVRDVQVQETHCAVPPTQVSRPGGRRLTVDARGQVWEVGGPGLPATAVGRVAADGSVVLGETRYGADRCVYEVTWSPPASSWPHRLARLNPVRWTGGLLWRQVRSQQKTIQLLRNQVRDLQRTLEARVLERTEGLRQKARQMALVEQAGRRFGALLDPDALCQEVVRTLREELGYFSVALYLWEEERFVLRALHTGDSTVEEGVGWEVRVPPAALEALRVAGRPLAQRDLATQPHALALPRLGRARAALTAPLLASNRLLGVLELQSPRHDRFANDDDLVLHAVAAQAALTLERSRLYREEQRARQHADTMSVLAGVINTTLELNQVLPLALAQLRRVLPYDAAAVVLLEERTPGGSGLPAGEPDVPSGTVGPAGYPDHPAPPPPRAGPHPNGTVAPAGYPDGGVPTVATSTGFPPQSEALLGRLFTPTPAGPLERVLRQAEPVLLGASARPAIPEQLDYLASWLAVPLVLRGTTAGALLLAARAPNAYGSAEVRLAQGLAGQVATALSNARLYARIRQDHDRLDALYRVARELNTDLEIDEVLRHILGSAQESVGAAAGSIILLDEAGRPAHSILLRPSNETETVLEQVLRAGAAGWVTRNQQGLLIPDTAVDSRWLRLPNEARATRSAIIVPLLAQGQAHGVLTVTHPQAGHFDPDDLELLTSMAGQAGSVVQRARLFTAIRGERARLETVIEGTADAVIVLDEAGRVLRINRSAAELFALEVAAVSGRPLGQALPHPAVAALLRPVGNPGARRRAEIPLADGRTLYATLTPIPGLGAVITMQDISYLKEMDRMKSDFVATVSHDLRTPLGAVQGMAEMLELAGPLNDDQARFVRRILHQTGAMGELVENLLDLAKIEAGLEMAMAPCQLAAVIAESLDQLAEPAALRPVRLRTAVPADLPPVWGNGRRLEQVVNNLLDNAIKYTPPNSEVTLRAGVEGTAVRVDISDQGEGIPQADLPRLFEKFYRARQSASGPRGTGLGLSICHSIVQAHGGRIWAESPEGHGATFSFVLPIWGGKE